MLASCPGGGVAAREGAPPNGVLIVANPDAQLVVRYRTQADQPPASTEAIVDAINRPGASADAERLWRRLQQPAAAEILIRERMSDERLAHLLRLDAPEARLQQYVILTYANPERARAAQQALLLDPAVAAASRNLVFDYSVVPQDPLYFRQSQWRWEAGNGTQFPPFGFWAAAFGLDLFYNQQLELAWDHVRGTAYVSVMDNGIQLKPAEHPDLRWLFRPHFSQNVANGSPNVDELAHAPAGAVTSATPAGMGPTSPGSLPPTRAIRKIRR